jgi:hypothetical protein
MCQEKSKRKGGGGARDGSKKKERYKIKRERKRCKDGGRIKVSKKVGKKRKKDLFHYKNNMPFLRQLYLACILYYTERSEQTLG